MPAGPAASWSLPACYACWARGFLEPACLLCYFPSLLTFPVTHCCPALPLRSFNHRLLGKPEAAHHAVHAAEAAAAPALDTLTHDSLGQASQATATVALENDASAAHAGKCWSSTAVLSGTLSLERV
jgi:hypothetical protein